MKISRKFLRRVLLFLRPASAVILWLIWKAYEWFYLRTANLRAQSAGNGDAAQVAGFILGVKAMILIAITIFVIGSIIYYEDVLLSKILNAVLAQWHVRAFRGVRRIRPKRPFYGSVTAIPEEHSVSAPVAPWLWKND